MKSEEGPRRKSHFAKGREGIFITSVLISGRKALGMLLFADSQIHRLVSLQTARGCHLQRFAFGGRHFECVGKGIRVGLTFISVFHHVGSVLRDCDIFYIVITGKGRRVCDRDCQHLRACVVCKFHVLRRRGKRHLGIQTVKGQQDQGCLPCKNRGTSLSLHHRPPYFQGLRSGIGNTICPL